MDRAPGEMRGYGDWLAAAGFGLYLTWTYALEPAIYFLLSGQFEEEYD